MWFTEVLCNSSIGPQGSFFHSQFLLPRIFCQLGAVGVDAALMGALVCPVDDQAQGLVRGRSWEKRTGQWASAADKEGGSDGTPATAESSGHAWTAGAQKEPSMSRWQGPRHSACHPAAGPWDMLTGGPRSQPHLAPLLRPTLRDRKARGSFWLASSFSFLQCSITFLVNQRFEIYCLLARF